MLLCSVLLWGCRLHDHVGPFRLRLGEADRRLLQRVSLRLGCQQQLVGCRSSNLSSSVCHRTCRLLGRGLLAAAGGVQVAGRLSDCSSDRCVCVHMMMASTSDCWCSGATHAILFCARQPSASPLQACRALPCDAKTCYTPGAWASMVDGWSGAGGWPSSTVSAGGATADAAGLQRGGSGCAALVDGSTDFAAGLPAADTRQQVARSAVRGRRACLNNARWGRGDVVRSTEKHSEHMMCRAAGGGTPSTSSS
jgi:hypothetical protein